MGASTATATRRQFLATAGGVGLVLAVRPAKATPASMKQAIRQIVGEAGVTRGFARLAPVASRPHERSDMRDSAW
jgi:hypothetical protein